MGGGTGQPRQIAPLRLPGPVSHPRDQMTHSVLLGTRKRGPGPSARAGTVARVHPSGEVIDVPITLNGTRVQSVTRIASVGAHVLVITTVIPSPQAPVTLTSSYVGARETDTHVTHLLQRPDHPHGQLETHEHLPERMPVAADQRRGCLYDHLQLLLAALNERGCEPGIDVHDDALDAVDR
jgi:hypothetical protein